MDAIDWIKLLEESCQQIDRLLADYRNDADVLKLLSEQMTPMMKEIQELKGKLYDELQADEAIDEQENE